MINCHIHYFFQKKEKKKKKRSHPLQYLLDNILTFSLSYVSLNICLWSKTLLGYKKYLVHKHAFIAGVLVLLFVVFSLVTSTYFLLTCKKKFDIHSFSYLILFFVIGLTIA
ncbi:hypothetical protein ACOSQ3_018243 [Xanthoceras sorbifolium]